MTDKYERAKVLVEETEQEEVILTSGDFTVGDSCYICFYEPMN